MYTSTRLAHDVDLYLNDLNVVLCGLLDGEELRACLHGSLAIELHDRNRLAHAGEPPRPCLFGHDAKTDASISSVSLAAAKPTRRNPFEAKDQHWDPHGLAQVSLYELVLGQRMLELSVPVRPCDYGRSAAAAAAATRDQPMPAGEYLDANTQLSLTVWVAKPVFSEAKLRRKQLLSVSDQPDSCVFSRLIVRVNAKRLDIVKLVIACVLEINSRALQITNQSQSVQEAALSTYKLTE